MKEVKEVVHVPTKELAEEVLRVGSENGLCKNITDLDVFIKSFHRELCFSFNDGICVSATHYYYEQEKYKIITAQEFLIRYKDSELEQLRKENAELKQQLKAIEDQPKVGDVCLFWDNHTGMYVISKLNENGGIDGVGKYDNYIKATPENIKAKIEELKND